MYRMSSLSNDDFNITETISGNTQTIIYDIFAWKKLYACTSANSGESLYLFSEVFTALESRQAKRCSGVVEPHFSSSDKTLSESSQSLHYSCTFHPPRSKWNCRYFLTYWSSIKRNKLLAYCHFLLLLRAYGFQCSFLLELNYSS